jgi:hypothetical protein
VHVPRADDELDTARLEPLRERDVARLAARVIGGVEDAGLDPGSLGTLECANSRFVRPNADDREPCVDQRLQVRSFA